MWWLKLRPLYALGLAALVAGCFQPLYGAHSPTGGPTVRNALAGVEVLQIEASKGSPEARIAVELRNALVFELTGGAGQAPQTHRLAIRVRPTRQAIIVDIATGRNEAIITGINAEYVLTEIATGKTVIRDTTFSRVSADVPGQQQRFAQMRANRDAEDRAVRVIAEQIRARLASYLVAGT